MKVDNVWYYKVDSDVEKSVIKYFTSRNVWGDVINREAEFKKNRYGDVDLSKMYHEHRYVDVPEEIYNHVYDQFYLYMDMFQRWSPWSLFIYDQRNIHDYLHLFNRDINFIYWLLKEKEISLVIFPRAPHMGGDLVLYLLAEKMGIRVLLLEQHWFRPNTFFHHFDLYDYGTFETSKRIAEQKEVKIEQDYEKNLWYMNELYRKKNKKSLRNLLSKRFRPEYRLLVESFTHHGWKQSLYRYSLRKKYQHNIAEIVDDNVDLEKSFVYFPLHLQPEQTTSIWGGKYTDQLLAIERLSEKLPNGWFIYVKENPGQNFYMRGDFFFERLKAIPNVKVVPSSMNTYKLLEKSKFVATITGTVGWEAISGGKNALVFGWGVWYKTLPGVFEYHEDLDINDILNYNIDHEELESKLSDLYTKLGTGMIHCQEKKAFPDYDEESNKKYVIDSLEKILYG